MVACRGMEAPLRHRAMLHAAAAGAARAGRARARSRRQRVVEEAAAARRSRTFPRAQGGALVTAASRGWVVLLCISGPLMPPVSGSTRRTPASSKAPCWACLPLAAAGHARRASVLPCPAHGHARRHTPQVAIGKLQRPGPSREDLRCGPGDARMLPPFPPSLPCTAAPAALGAGAVRPTHPLSTPMAFAGASLWSGAGRSSPASTP